MKKWVHKDKTAMGVSVPQMQKGVSRDLSQADVKQSQ